VTELNGHRAGARADRMALDLEAHPAEVDRGRRALQDLIRPALPEDRVADALLLTSELLANAIRHAPPGAITLRAELGRASVRVEVHDSGPGLPDLWWIRLPPSDGTGGRGLMLVAAIADRWGAATHPTSVVWFELSRPARR
jgi:serine/threonine-protein kinase RsbW